MALKKPKSHYEERRLNSKCKLNPEGRRKRADFWSEKAYIGGSSLLLPQIMEVIDVRRCDLW
jgi:hypothetical protein